MKKYIVIVLILWFSNGFSQNVNSFFDKADVFFKTYVSNGKVAYDAIYKNKTNLVDVLKLAETITISKNDEKIYQAFWINAYNLAVIKGIIDKHPTNSPMDIVGFFDKTTYALGGEKITLNAIENTKLRAPFKDTRFHFVLVCGAMGCPPLINKAYLPKTLDAQLESQTKKAVNSNFIKVNTANKTIEVSQIMEWYKEDFTMNGKTEIDFINTYRTEKIPNNVKLKYIPYNWELNKQ